MNISDATPPAKSRAPGLPLKRQTGSLEDSLCTDLKGGIGRNCPAAKGRLLAGAMMSEGNSVDYF
jgi:hypothetical protein